MVAFCQSFIKVMMMMNGWPARWAFAFSGSPPLVLLMMYGDDCRWMAGANINKVCKLQVLI